MVVANLEYWAVGGEEMQIIEGLIVVEAKTQSRAVNIEEESW